MRESDGAHMWARLCRKWGDVYLGANARKSTHVLK